MFVLSLVLTVLAGTMHARLVEEASCALFPVVTVKCNPPLVAFLSVSSSAVDVGPPRAIIVMDGWQVDLDQLYTQLTPEIILE